MNNRLLRFCTILVTTSILTSPLASAPEAAAANGEASLLLRELVDVRAPPAQRLAALDSLVKSGPKAGPLLIESWPRLTPLLRDAALGHIVGDETASLAFLEALDASRLLISDVDTRALYAMRTHDSKSVRTAAERVLTSLEEKRRSGRGAVLEDISRHAAPGPGDRKQGAQLFETHCSICHEYAGRGKDLGPHLGGHALDGRDALLSEIIDPNREVASEYVAYTAVLKSGETQTGMISSEGEASLVLEQNGRADVLAREDLLALEAAGISLMPEGLERSLGPAALRDIVAYLTKDAPPEAAGFRALSLRLAANADGSQGLYTSRAAVRESLPFKSHGAVTLAGIPFTLLHPAATGGRNLLVLQGGPPGSLARTYPRRAVLECGARVEQVHILGGVGGWGFPTTADPSDVLTITLRYASGAPDLHTWKNGVEVTDSHRRADVPRSRRVLRLGRRQVRLITLEVARPEALENLLFESAAGPVAPLVAAVTVELAP